MLLQLAEMILSVSLLLLRRLKNTLWHALLHVAAMILSASLLLAQGVLTPQLQCRLRTKRTGDGSAFGSQHRDTQLGHLRAHENSGARAPKST